MRRPTVAALAAVAAATSCGACREAPQRTEPVVAVSVAPQAYFVEQLAGNLVDVVVMIPPGASPHTYEPSMQQMRALTDASLYIEVGHPHFTFERAWLDKLLAGNPSLPVVDSSKGIQEDQEDPHVWVSPPLVRVMAANIAAALADLLPDDEARLAANRTAFEREIDRLDTDIRNRLRGLRKRRFYVFHPAWGYFADAYGLEQVAIESEGKEPDPSRLAALIRRAKEDGVTVVFTQPQVSSAGARVVAEAIGARVEVIDPQARDWASNLRHVADLIAEALS